MNRANPRVLGLLLHPVILKQEVANDMSAEKMREQVHFNALQTSIAIAPSVATAKPMNQITHASAQLDARGMESLR